MSKPKTVSEYDPCIRVKHPACFPSRNLYLLQEMAGHRVNLYRHIVEIKARGPCTVRIQYVL
jgi:hypothetical protein